MLNRVVQKVCKEEQVYRIDHYLGKDGSEYPSFRFLCDI